MHTNHHDFVQLATATGPVGASLVDGGSCVPIDNTLSEPCRDQLDNSNGAPGVSAMGTILSEDDVSGTSKANEDFYGSSSTASFVK